MTTRNTTGLGGTSGTLAGTTAGRSKVIKASALTLEDNDKIVGAKIAKKTAPDPNQPTTFDVAKSMLASMFPPTNPFSAAAQAGIQATPPLGIDLGDIGKMFAGLGGSSKTKESDDKEKEKDGDGNEVASKDDDKSKDLCANGKCGQS